MSSTELKLFDFKGKEVGTKAVSENIFACEISEGLLHQVVRWQRAKRRAGTHSTKTRAQMSGGGRKPWRQKGLGRARSGSNTSSIWVGGGIAHGPKPRSYEFSINKKERKRALCSAISSRNLEGRCLALTEFGLNEIKTQKAVKVLEALGIKDGERAVIVATDDDTHVAKSLGNVSGVTTLPVAGLNVYDILNAKYLIVTEKALDGIEQRLSAN